EAADNQAIGQTFEGRELRCKATVHKDQPTRGLLYPVLCNLHVRNQPAAILGKLEFCVRDRGNVREPPVLDPRRRKSRLAKSCESILAQSLEPGQFSSCRLIAEAAKRGQVICQLLSLGDHRRFSIFLGQAGVALRATASIELYPFSSSLSARSGPPAHALTPSTMT